mmetsp:Transcript_40414/g.35873  ORF Transcript_40414/g.35873 Transcript_40414/m.35873 type:complete len:81 (-) Transcript_40414:37-279(-)
MSNPEEIAASIFQQFDKDGSGSIDAAEVKAMLEETYKGLKHVVTDDDVKHALSYMDSDGSGTISKDEYISMFKKAFENQK